MVTPALLTLYYPQISDWSHFLVEGEVYPSRTLGWRVNSRTWGYLLVHFLNNYPHFMGMARVNLALQGVPAFPDLVISIAFFVFLAT